MNPLSFVTRPIRDLTQAVLLPFKAIFVVGLCFFINWMTSPGHWWVQWVAFGMGIAVLVAWARAARTLLVLAVVGYVGWKIYERYGQAARDRFDAWVQRTQPQAAEVVQMFRSPAQRASVIDAAH